MGTRAAAFTAKIRNLHDYQLRLLHGIMPVPSGVDIANTLKYFSQTLLTVLKDVPNSPLEMLKSADKDIARMGLYPNLDYRGLNHALVQLMDVAPLIQYGLQVFGQALLQCLGCLMSFLEHDLLDALPYLTASTMAVLPAVLHQEVVNSLCYYILPFTITRCTNDDQENYASQSVAAVIMMVFQYSENPAHHCQLLECLMTTKKNVVKDLMCVIAYGTANARASAVKLLFYYWPTFNPNLFDRRMVLQKFATDIVPFVCQRDMCPNSGNAEAAKVCFDHCISITFASDSPPPLYLCIECANEIHREHPNQMFFDILHPMQQVSMTCENKNCRATDKSAVSICFSTECASYNSNHPIRYCQQCHNIRHNNRRGGDHIIHRALVPLWDMDADMQSYVVEAIVSLLKEAKPLDMDSSKEVQPPESHGKASLLTVQGVADPRPLEERQLLGRYGVWLLVGLCTPTESTPVDVLGRLLAMLLHWFDVTAYSFDDQAESTLERLKIDFVCDWLTQLCKTHFKVFVSCLLPHPADYARVGGHWDTLVPRTTHLKDGLNRLFCLVPYEVISADVWDHVMPHWMEALVHDVGERELMELKMVLSKILDADMSPLGFDAKKLYRFVAIRFKKTSPKVQEQALSWLQVLTMLEIVIPLHLLFSMFSDGVRMMRANLRDGERPGRAHKSDDVRRSSISPVVENESDNTSALSEDEAPSLRPTELQTDTEVHLSCCILMLDVLGKQLQLQEVERHSGVHTTLAQDVCRLLKCMVSASWTAGHVCATSNDCAFCESCVIWYQLALELVEFLAPEALAHPPDSQVEEADGADEGGHGRKSPSDADKKSEPKPDVVINMPIPEIHSVGGVLVHMPHKWCGGGVDARSVVLQIMTATVETVTEQLDLAPIIPAEKVVAAVARAVTITDTDVATATVQVAKATLVGENDQPIEVGADEELDDFWHTSVGKFRFSLDELPQQLQFIHHLLKELPSIEQPDILYYMLQCVHVLSLHGDALTKAAKDHRGFLIWCQENLTIKNLWELCNAEHSHICQVCVPLLLHCITLPSGSDVFWKVVQEEFHSTDWRVRFVAVERVTVMARFMDSTPLRGVSTLQAALANAFCYLIACVDDINVQVAQRATLYLGTIHDCAIKSLILCLESQFDTVIVDRPVVLQSLYQLHNCLSDRRVLSWDFFLSRFDALFLEAQLTLQRSGDLSYLRDLRNTDLNSEAFLRKLHRAHEALSVSQQSDGATSPSLKTLSASFGPKWPYKRTMSAPASITPRQDSKQEKEKEKVYSRQYSAPILKRKSSRFGLDGHIQSLSTTDDGNLVGFLQRVIDLEEADRETVHLLIFLLMQFLSRSDQAYPSDEKALAKTQSIVLRHLYLLLGYSQGERTFHITPQRLRSSPVFGAFLANLPQLLDQNHLMGWKLVPTCLLLLQYCPNPQRAAVSAGTDAHSPGYSLWYLEPHTRRCWLMALLVLLYKYQYSQQQPHSSQLQSLVKIVLNSLEAQHHLCRRIPGTFMAALPARSRDMSQPSLGGDAEHSGAQTADRHETPPLSPLYGAEGTAQVCVGTKGAKAHATYHHKSGMDTHWEETVRCSQADGTKVVRMDRKMPEASYSVDNDETESELAAIPESPKSDSTLQGSVQGSLDDVTSTEEAAPTRPCMHAHAVVQQRRPVWFLGSEEDTLQTSETNHDTWPAQVVQVVQVQAHTSGAATAMEMSRQEPWADHPPHGSPVPRPQARLRRPAEEGPSQQPSWQMDVHKGELATPSVERLLPIGTSRAVAATRNEAPLLPQDSQEDPYGSLDSPLSKMDLMTVGSPIEVDSENNVSSEVTSTCSASQLELPVPAPERLLPVGWQQHEDVACVVDRVKQGLGLPPGDAPPLTPRAAVQERRPADLSLRRLIKQLAVDSPPTAQPQPLPQPQPEGDDGHPAFYRGVHHDRKGHHNAGRGEEHPRTRQWSRKTGVFSMGQHSMSEHPRRPGSWCGPQAVLDPVTQQACHAEFDLKQSSFRVGDDCVYDRCSECGQVKEEYSDEELGLCITVLGTFVHREPALAAPLLPDILSVVAGVALNASYPWQSETNIYLPGGAVSVAHQFLRCVLHQLAPNGVFVQMFQTQVEDSLRMQFFRSVAQALLDFNELNPIAPLQLLLEGLNSRKSLPVEVLPVVLRNMACYLDCLPLEAGLGPCAATWTALLAQLDMLFRRLVLLLPALEDAQPLLRIMVSVLKVPGISAFKSLLEPFSKVVSYAVQNVVVRYHVLADLCHLCTRGFTRDREKLFLTRTAVFELVQAIKFKSSVPDCNLVVLVNMVLQDAGGLLAVPSVLEECSPLQGEPGGPVFSTGAAECMRHHLVDAIDFLADLHTLSKVKSYCKGLTVGLNEDTLGGVIKAGLAQLVALEMTRGSRDSRAVARYLPWLHSAPSVLQQGPREFIDCVSHIRLLSWLLLGSLTHTAVQGCPASGSPCAPIPQDASCHISDHVQVIMAGFAEQSKASVLHMSALFHAFLLCQLWTVYLEQLASHHVSNPEAHSATMGILLDFWGKVTPCILQLVSHSKGLADMVNLHFLSLLEALQECNASLLSKLLPLWSPVLFAYHVQLPGHLQVRLQGCRNFPPPPPGPPHGPWPRPVSCPELLRWLHRLHFKMAQVELQSAAATHFYTV